MKRTHLIIAAAVLGMLWATPARAQVNIFACEPEWASLAREIGGGLVETYAATNAAQDPHHIRARPSLIAAMRKADMVVCSGAELEIGWLPLLLQKAGKAGVQPGGSFSIMAAEHVPVLEKTGKVDRSMGDVHPQGNPHVHLNPHNILKVAQVLADRLQKLDPANAQTYRKNYNAFAAKWKQAMQKWGREGQSLKGRKIMTHHKSWSYLIDWLGMELANTLEPKPGIPPNTGHLEALLQQARQTRVLAIVRAPYNPDDAAEWLSGKSGIPVLELPYTVGGDKPVTDLFSLYDVTLQKMRGAIDAKP
jgi:zinc/manganese transport system substrate-binding protein